MLRRFFYDKWVDKYLSGKMQPAEIRQMQWELKMSLFASDPIKYWHKKWGWKNPRTIFLISFLVHIYPNMRYIHVVRDGRDIAFNPKFDYRTHNQFLLSEEEKQTEDHVRKAIFWEKTNTLAMEDCRQYLGNHTFNLD